MKIGIFGGTFDPVHNGHLLCAQEVMRQLHFDKVLLIPTGDPPHKITRRITPAADRLAMLDAALQGIAGFEVSDLECRRPDYTYTYDTLIALRKTAGENDAFYMIVGADTLSDLFNWYRAEDVFRLCSFAAMKRPGCDEPAFRENLRKAAEAGARIIPVEVPQIDVSSTQVRRAAAAGEPLSGLVPERVAAYIREKRLYSARKMGFEEIYEDLRQILSAKRFAHSVGVMEESVRLAKLFGADLEKCRLAGLLHDCAKELTEQQYRWLGLKTPHLGEYDVKRVLLHGEAGAILAEARYGIGDSEILEAVRCHITGKPEMGLAAQIVFVADFTEPGRCGAHFDAVRKQVENGSLRGAILTECDNTIRYKLSQNGQLCTETVRTRNWILQEMHGKAEGNG